MADEIHNEADVEVIESMLGKIREEFPEIAAVLDRAKDNNDPQGGLEEISQLLQQDPAMVARVSKTMAMSLAVPSEVVKDQIGGAYIDEPDKLTRLNPLTESYIIERLQFDGDIPEMRTGPLPPGADPAVPVLTDARSPVFIGKLLQTAAAVTRQAVEDHTEQETKRIESFASKTGLAKRHTATMIETIDHPEYLRGQVPAPVTVTAPTGAELATMGDQERQKLTWKVLSTSQGRRSARPVIERLVRAELERKGLAVSTGDIPDPRNVLAHHAWSVTMPGEGALNPRFQFLDVAVKALAAGLIRQLSETDGSVGDVVLHVGTRDQISSRQFGWDATLRAAT